MRIADDIIEEIRAVADVVEVVGDYVQMKKRGTNFIGLCPFHSEKTPSFNVNPRLGIFKCFGCGEGGDVFSFVSRIENVGFPEAVRMLGERYGVVIPESEDEGPEGGEQESILFALRFAARFFYRQLTTEPAGETARTYLRDRGVTAVTAKKFGLGYAPDSWDSLLREATEASISEDMLVAAGLILPRREGGFYDRYRHRLIFPIQSHVGKVLGFGGRILVTDPKQPKYVNSPETAVYHKSRVLYGLHHAKNAIRGKEEAVLVEGYTDVLALHQAGVEHVVASSGTALTVDQVQLLRRYAKRVLLLYDGDEAGARAVRRGIDLCLEGGIVPYVVALPVGEDPDSYATKHGPKGFEDYLAENRMEFVAYLYERARLEGQLESPDSKAAVQHEIVGTIGRIADTLLRESYMHQASAVLDVPEVYLRRSLETAQKKAARTAGRRVRRDRSTDPSRTVGVPDVPHPAVGSVPPTEPTGGGAPDPDATPKHGDPRAVPVTTPGDATGSRADVLPEEKTLLRLMLDHGTELVQFVLTRTALDEFTEGPAREAVAELVAMYARGRIDRKPFLEGALGRDVQQLVSEVMTDAMQPSENWGSKRIEVPRFNEDPIAAATSAMGLLKLDRLDGMIAEIRHLIFGAEQEGSDVRMLQQELMKLQQTRRRIEDRKFLE